MIAKEKAQQLVNRYLHVWRYRTEEAKQFALICVDEMLLECNIFRECYWLEVKQEINKL